MQTEDSTVPRDPVKSPDAEIVKVEVLAPLRNAGKGIQFQDLIKEIFLPDGLDALKEQIESMYDLAPRHQTIVDEQGLADASAYLTDLLSLMDEVKGKIKPQKDAAHALHKVFTGLETAMLAVPTAIKEAVDKGMKEYYRVVQARRDAAEKERRYREAMAQQEFAETRQQAADSGIDPASIAPPPVEESAFIPPSLPGMSRKSKWTWRLDEEHGGFAAVPDAFKMLNEKMLNAKATSEKGKASVPGIMFYEDSSFARK